MIPDMAHQLLYTAIGSPALPTVHCPVVSRAGLELDYRWSGEPGVSLAV